MPKTTVDGVRPMHAIALRRARLTLAALLTALGLSFAPPLAETAAAATNREVCHSVTSDTTSGTGGTPYITVFNTYWDGRGGYNLYRGQCRDFEITELRVWLPVAASWKFSSSPSGAWGACKAHAVSYPQQDYNRYRTFDDNYCVPG